MIILSDYLGCCSYKTFEEFIECDYFKDMVHSATEDLKEEIVLHKDIINKASA